MHQQAIFIWVFIGLLWGCLPAEVQSQTNPPQEKIADTVQVAEVVVEAVPVTYANPLIDYGADMISLSPRELRQYQFSTTAELLEDVSGLRVNNYGPGLATFSRQGLGSVRSQLDLPFDLASPASGLVDLSVLPTSLLMRFPTDFGNNNPNELYTDWNTGGAVGSWGERQFSIDFRGSVAGSKSDSLLHAYRRTGFDFSLFHVTADNDYPTIDERSRSRRLPNAQSDLWAGRVDLRHELGLGSTIYASLIGLTSDRQIPPSLDQFNSRAAQQDRQWFGRAGIEYSSRKSHLFGKLELRSSDLELRYTDPDLDLDATTHAQSHRVEAIISHSRLSGAPSLLLSGDFQRASPNNGPWQTRSWWSGGLQIPIALVHNQRRTPTWVLHLQPELTAGSVPTNRPIPLWNIEIKNDYSNFSFRHQRQLRRPTLNDLFWPELGRSNLNPERIETWQINYENRRSQDRSIRPEFSVFHHRIENAIRWLPEGGQFRPRNFNQLLSSGISGSLELKPTEQWLFGLAGQYAYVREDASGRQIAYEPRFNSTSRLRYASKKFAATYRLQYQSSVFTLNGIDNRLSETWLHHADLSYTLGKGKVEIQLRLRNLFDLRYQRIAGYPLPGRHWRLQIIYSAGAAMG
ncbi:MAG: TonB-dependent receptor [Bacteroidota bacterium]